MFNLIDAIASAESPLTEVMKLFPKVAYAVDSGLLNTQIQNLIGKLGMGLGSSINVDLTNVIHNNCEFDTFLICQNFV